MAWGRGGPFDWRPRAVEPGQAEPRLTSHAEIALSEGEIYDNTIECWLHGSCFDLRTGKPTNPPATEPVTTYRVKVEDGAVYISLDSEDWEGPDLHGHA